MKKEIKNLNKELKNMKNEYYIMEEQNLTYKYMIEKILKSKQNNKDNNTINEKNENENNRINEKTNDEEEFKSKMGFELKDTFQGVNTISEQSFLHAKELVNQFRLQDDEYINTIIRKRDPKKENHKLTEHLYCEAMQEFNKCIDVAAAFNAASVFNLSSNVKHAISQKVEYSLNIDVAFPTQ